MKEQDIIKAHGIHNPKRSLKEPLKKRLLTLKEAALYLGRSVPSFRELYWSGALPFVRSGKILYFDIHDLDAWIETNKNRHTF